MKGNDINKSDYKIIVVGNIVNVRHIDGRKLQFPFYLLYRFYSLYNGKLSDKIIEYFESQFKTI